MSMICTSFLMIITQSLVQASNGQTGIHNPQDRLSATFFQPGNARSCIEQGRQTDFPLRRLASLPGIGWDNLRNMAAGQIVAFNYTLCKTTEDGRYLLPDDVFTIPVKTSLVESLAEMFDTSKKITSTTAKSINLNAGLSYDAVEVSGSYSQEHTRMKSSQVKDDSVATRIQLRYHRYIARLQPGSLLHPNFKSRLLSVAGDIDKNLTQSARYKVQLIVRDYGTHVLTSVTAGAGLVKTDFVHRSYVDSHSSNKKAISAAASASFASTFKFDASYNQSSGSAANSEYQKSLTDSYITTYGGPILRPNNMSVSQWVNGIDTDLVSMDRSGEPLSLLITDDLFPELPTPLRDSLEKFVMEAIEQYYEMNTIRGCTKRGSPNFSPSANVDDRSCMETKSNFTFGGVFQTCTVEGSYLSASPCSDLSQVNHLTQSHTCPPGHMAVKLAKGTRLGKRESTKKCKRCGFLWLKHCCHYNFFQAKGNYETFWCAPNTSASGYSSVLFGGLYATTFSNLVTGAKSCPPTFHSQHIFQEHTICLGDVSGHAENHAVPFGGFTSCSVGNPLASLQTDQDGKTATKDPKRWPMKCPEGYNQHLANIDDGCPIRYCIRTGSLTSPVNPPIKRPPFFTKPESIAQEDVFLILNNGNSFKHGGQIVHQEIFDHVIRTNQTPDTSAHDPWAPRFMRSTSSPSDSSPAQSQPSLAVIVASLHFTTLSTMAVLSGISF